MRSAASFALFLALCLSSFTGCATNGFARLDSHGFRSHEHPFAVAYKAPATRDLMPSEWVLDNVRRDRRDARELLPKLGPAWQSSISLDTNGDGVADHVETVRDSELVFRHERTDASIWLSVYPLPQRRERVDLDVIAREYVEGVSSTGRVSTIALDGGGAWVSVAEKRYATRILTMVPMTLSGSPALRVTFDVANVDQLQLAADARWSRATVVFARPGWWWSLGGDVWPVVVVVGYESLPQRFDESVQDFDDLLTRTELYGDTAKLDALGPSIVRCVGAPGRGGFAYQVTADGRIDGAPQRVARAPSATSGAVLGLAGQRCAADATRGLELTPAGFPRTVVSIVRPTYEAPRPAAAPPVPVPATLPPSAAPSSPAPPTPAAPLAPTP